MCRPCKETYLAETNQVVNDLAFNKSLSADSIDNSICLATFREKGDRGASSTGEQANLLRKMSRATGLPIQNQLYSNLSFTDMGLQALQEGQWVTDEPVDLFSVIESEESQYVFYIPSTAYAHYFIQLEQGIINLTVINNRFSPHPHRRRQEMQQRNMWITTICDHGHWQVLCILNLGKEHCFSLLLDSLIRGPAQQSANLHKCEQFAQGLLTEIYGQDSYQHLHIGNIRTGLVPVQPNFVDCGVFAILNVKTAISKVQELTSLMDIETIYSFQDWYTVDHALGYRRNLRQQYERLLDQYGQATDSIHAIYESD